MLLKSTWILVISLILSSCESVKFQVPIVEKCLLIPSENVCYCINGQSEYEKPIQYCEGFIAISPDSLKIEEDFFMDKVRRLENCLTAKKYGRSDKCQ